MSFREATAPHGVPPEVTRRALVVGNPAARGVTPELMEEIGALLHDSGAESTTLWTSRPGEATSLVEAALGAAAHDGQSATTVIAVGGDGTVQEVAEGVVRSLGAWPGGAPAASDTGLCIVPAGAGNSAFMAIWSATDWRDALRGACSANRQLRNIDLLHVRETTSATLLGVNIGLGARVAELLAGVEHVDETVRWRAIGQALGDSAAFPGLVTIDGETLYEGQICQVAVGGVRRFLGGAFEFLPLAELDDGRLDVCVIAEIDEGSVGDLGALIPAGKHIGHPLVRYAKGRIARVARTDGRDLTLEHDGDLRVARDAITIEAVTGVLPIAFSGPDDSGPRRSQAGQTAGVADSRRAGSPGREPDPRSGSSSACEAIGDR